MQIMQTIHQEISEMLSQSKKQNLPKRLHTISLNQSYTGDSISLIRKIMSKMLLARAPNI